MELKTEVLNTVRTMMAGSGMSQRMLSRKLGKSEGYIGSTLTQEKSISAVSLLEIAHATGYDLIAVGHDETLEIGHSSMKEGDAAYGRES